jgi:hypothetical protein
LYALLICSFTFSGVTSIVKYAPSAYGAGNQNWMISQDESHYLFFANNEGLLNLTDPVGNCIHRQTRQLRKSDW